MLPWMVLTVGFAVLSLDEAVAIHEWMIVPMENLLGTKGHHLWLIPALSVVGFVGLLFIPFLRSLPSTTRNMFILGGVLYLGGAAGFEIVGGLIIGKSWLYQVVMPLEEVLELLGLLVFIHGLTSYLVAQLRSNYFTPDLTYK